MKPALACALTLVAMTLAACSSTAPSTATAPRGGIVKEGASYSAGVAKQTIAGLIDCGGGSRVSAVGETVSDDGKSWIVPAATHFETGPKAADLYNDCSGNTLDNTAALDVASLQLIDAGGSEEFVAYVFADNYFELYVNGKLLAVDPVPFTPFNSSVVRFKANRPLTIAFMGVDWEEKLGLGLEVGRGSRNHPGDAGLVAVFNDASGNTIAMTDASWKAQTFYTAPLSDFTCLVERDGMRDSSACSIYSDSDGSDLLAAHWALPQNWMEASFDDNSWPAATLFSNETVGVDNKNAYTNFTDIFDKSGADAQFIWSSNLVLDNLVILRKRVD